MNILTKGLGNSLRVPPQRSQGITPPDWATVPHKGMKKLSAEEFKKKLEETAKGWENAVTDKDYEDNFRQQAQLLAQYISSVSPDRKTMYKEAMEEIKNWNSAEAMQEPTPQKTLIDFLNERDNDKEKGRVSDKPYALKSGGTITAISNSHGGYNYEIKSGLETVMSVDTNRGTCTYTYTKAELEKKVDFYKMFNSACRKAKWEQENGPAPKAEMFIDVKA